VPKLELLKASAQGRLHGFEAYKKALNYVALNYPNDKEGKEAQHIIDTQLSKLQPNAFVQQVNGKWKLVYPIAKNDQASWDDLHKVVTHSFKEEKRADLKISKDVYDGQQLFLVIHSFPSKEFAEGFAELLNKNKKYQVNNENFVVLSENYKIIQIHKNLQTYLNK
jgi:hypothetical protein